MLGVPVVRPEVAETTALGAAYAAGLAVGFWDSEEDIRANWAEDKTWKPQMAADDARRAYAPVEEGRHPHVRLGVKGGRPSGRSRHTGADTGTPRRRPGRCRSDLRAPPMGGTGGTSCRRRPLGRHHSPSSATRPSPQAESLVVRGSGGRTRGGCRSCRRARPPARRGAGGAHRHPAPVLITGPAGIGKSELVDRLRRHVEGPDGPAGPDGMTVVRAVAPDVEVSRPGALLERCLAAARAAGARPDDVPTGPSRPGAAALLAALEDLADHRPVLLVADDLHRADPESLADAAAPPAPPVPAARDDRARRSRPARRLARAAARRRVARGHRCG